MKGLLMLRAFSGQKRRMGDCGDRSSAEETRMLSIPRSCEDAAINSPENGPQSSQSLNH